LRLLASLGGYLYAVKGDHLFVNLYAEDEGAATVAGTKVQLKQTTDYPWNGKIELAVTPEKSGEFTVCVRIPGWVQGRPVPSDLYTYHDSKPAKWSVRVNGKKVTVNLEQGFLPITRTWKRGDVVDLDFPMPVRRVCANEQVAALRDQVALERGRWFIAWRAWTTRTSSAPCCPLPPGSRPRHARTCSAG
jgi:hypothetical protein